MSANIPDMIVEFNDSPPDASSSTWIDVSPYVLSANTKRGRQYDEDQFAPGTFSAVLDNSDGRFDPANTSGPYYGKLGVNRPWRIAFPGTFIGFGYLDALVRSWPGGVTYSETVMTATDRFKLMGKTTLGPLTRSATGPGEGTGVRITALLNGSAFPISIASINAAGYTARNVEATNYPAKTNTLQAVQDINMAEGGVLYVNGAGILTYKVAAARTNDTRSMTSQATYQFGTANVAGAFDVDIDLNLIYDDLLYTNFVRVTDWAGTEHVWPSTYPASNAVEFDLGQTLLNAVDAGFRARDLYARRFNVIPRVESLTLDAGSDPAYRVEALAREISDRVTLVIGPRGGGGTVTQDYFIESVAHDIEQASGKWLTTFGLNPVPPP